MEPYKVYYSPGEYKGYVNIGQARRAFINAALHEKLVVFVREDNIEYYDVTVHNPQANKVSVKKIGSKTQFEKYLMEVF